jgi:hypothetical protein
MATMAERDLDDLMRRMTAAKVHRRGFLAGTGLAGLSAFIAACTGGSSATPGTTSGSSAAPSASAPGSEAPP